MANLLYSTYAEVISCNGIIGTILYSIPFSLIICRMITVFLERRGTDVGSQSLMYLALMTVMVSLGLGVIHFYSIADNIMFALMISFYAEALSKIRQEAVTVKNPNP